MRMDKEDKPINDWLDWLHDSDGQPEGDVPQDDEARRELRRQMEDCNLVFARRSNPVPDVDQAWNAFREKHVPQRPRRRLRAWAMWGGWVGMAACAALLVWLQVLRPESAPEPVMMFTAMQESRGVTLSAGDGAVWELDDHQAGQALQQQGIRADARVADYRRVEQVETQTLTVPRGKDYHLALSDGTEVWINAESRLSYPSRFTGNERTVKLEGEAYFKVARDAGRPFTVQTGALSTRVLGTEFNLCAYADAAASVTLVSGRVAVKAGGSPEEYSLSPGQELTVEPDGKATLENVDTYARTQWKEGFFYFDHASLKEILCGLGRWYNVDIELDCDPALLDYHLHYVADRRGTLSEALEKLNGLKRVSLKLEGNRIVLE